MKGMGQHLPEIIPGSACWLVPRKLILAVVLGDAFVDAFPYPYLSTPCTGDIVITSDWISVS